MNLQNYSIPSSNEVELNQYEPLPVGWYNVQVMAEEFKQTLNGGTMLKYKLQVYADDKFQGRLLFTGFNLVCPGSPEAEKIARKQIAQMGKACKVQDVVDSKDLIGKTLKAHVIQEEYNGKINNKVTGFDYATNDAQPTPQAKADNGADVPFWMK